jgi:hypothetical protein
MIDPGWQRPNPPAAPPPSPPAPGPGRPAGTRTRNIAALTALSVTAALAIAATPALVRGLTGSAVQQPAPAQRVATVAVVTPAPSPTPVVAQPAMTAAPPPPAPTPVPARAPAAPAAAPGAAVGAVAAPVIVGPGAGCCSSSSGAWTTDEAGGSPGFRGPFSWTTSGAASFQWTLAGAGGQRASQVRVRVWIPNEHAGATVAYTVSSTGGGAPQTAVVSQNPTNGWYPLPGTFAPGTITVRLAYVRPATGPNGAACAGCDAMAAAQVRFDVA